MNATSGFRTPSSTAPAVSWSRRRSAVRRQLATVETLLQLGKTASPKERKTPPLGGQPPVEEDRQLELRRETIREKHGRLDRPGLVLAAKRDEGNDIRGADPRMHADVLAQIDLRDGPPDPGEQRLDELLPASDQREDGPVVVEVDVNIE